MSLEKELLELTNKRLKETKSKDNSEIAPIDVTKPVIAPVNKEAAKAAQQSLEQRKAKAKEQEEKNATWFQKGGFEQQGYQGGDFATVIDATRGVTRGVLSQGEGIVDFGAHLISRGLDAVNLDKAADAVKNYANMNVVGEWEEIVDETKFGEWVNENSLLGSKADVVPEAIGSVGFAILTAGSASGLGKVGATVATSAATFASSAGSGISEAYNSGATDGEAWAYGVMAGTVEAGTELLSGGLGNAVTAIGISRGIGGLDDIFAKKIASKIENVLARNIVEGAVKVTGEGLEEVIAALGNAVAKKLTYMSDEQIQELIKDEKVLESFVVGIIAAGVAEGGSVITSTKQGRDLVTGLTKEEQSVVDAVYKKRIEEATQNGENLNGKQKNEIYEKVVKDLEKGQISVETIEEVLGGESYKNYKDAVDSEKYTMQEMESLRDEYVELNKIKNSELTGEQTDRKAEIQKKLAELRTKYESSDKSNLKAKLNDDVYKLSKGTQLENSYIETAKKSEAFTADLSKYDKQTQATIKRAMDSGVLNNTQRTHEFVETMAELERQKGIAINFANNAKLKEMGYYVKGAIVNGVKTDSGMFLNVDSNKALETTVGHELMHFLEGDKDGYKNLKKLLFGMAKSKGEYGSRLKALEELYKNVDNVDIEAELAADLVGDYLFSDPDFIKNLLTEDKNLFHKIWREIKDLLKIVTPGTKEAKRLEKVEREFKKVFDEFKVYNEDAKANKNNSTKYDLSLDNQQNLVYNEKRGDDYARTDEFRKLQAESQGMSEEELRGYHRGDRTLDDIVRKRLSRVLGRQVGAVVSGNSYDYELLKLSDSKGNQFNIYEGVDGTLFHDCFEISRNYLKNGELVDLHTVETTEDGIGYNDCYNYLSEDGLSGFSITPDGDLISVFNASGKSGFLRAINSVIKAKAKTLDCYASPNQPLMIMYEKVFGFKTASVMDYNMDYDHDNIAQNHGMPKIAFMVNTDSDVETKSFSKDEYDEAVAYRNSFINKTTDNEIAPTKVSSNDDAFFDAKNKNYSLSAEANTQAKSQTSATELRYEGKDIAPTRGNYVGATETVKTNKNTTVKQKPVESKIEGFTEDYAPMTEADAEAMRSESFGSLSDADVPSGEYAPVANAPVKQTTAKRAKRVDAEEAHRGGEKERSWYETSTTSEAVNNMITPDDIPNDVRYYQVKSNKKTLAAANAMLEKNGYENSKQYFKARMEAKKLNVEDIVLGERLIQEAAKSGDAEGLRELIVDVSVIGTELGQKVQALSLIRRLSPEGQLLAMTRTVERGQKRGDKSFEGVEITDDMSKRITDVVKPDGTYDQAELNAAVEDVKQQIADQMSVSLREYLNGWRYLSMLGNPKTHIRNVVSNAAMFGTRAVKNAIARSAEDIFLKNRKTVLNTDDIGPVAQTPMRQVLAEGTKVKAADRNNIGTVRSFDSKTGKYTVYFKSPNGKTATVELDSNLVKPLYSETSNTATTSNNGESGPVHARTKTWKRATDVVKDFAKKTTTEMEVEITDGAKYSDEASIKAKRKIFKTKAGNFINDINSTSLEMEDAFFSRSTFKLTFQEYLTANGVTTESDIKNNPELIEKAKDYALEEAKRATFRQDSYIANKISEIENKNAALGVAIGSVMPFKKTPINVAKTGLAYSPLGLARATYTYIQSRNGKADITEAIDQAAQGLTGSALFAMGVFLASVGVLNGAGEDDKEGQYDYQLGEQAYSFNFNGSSYSLSWLSPVAIPLFAGANLYEIAVEQEEWDMNVAIDTAAQTLDPLSEMSFLSGLDDVLSSYESGMGKFAGAAGSMVQNYATQFIPTASSQLAATLDDTKRSTKASKDSGWAFGEETFNKVMYKIPGLRNFLEPSTDIWGNEVKQSDNFFVRGFESFINPANKREIITSDVDVEIKDLYGETGDSSVVPSIPYNYLNYNGKKYEMSSKEFTEYKKTYGQTAYDLLDDLFETETYKNATSEERADMVKRVYDYARDEAKREYFKGVDLEYTNATKDGVEYYKENAIKEAIAHDMTAEEYEFYSEKPAKHAVAKSVGGYKAYKAYQSALSKITADKNASGSTVSGSTVSGSRKKKVIQYINELDISFGEKLILFKNEYPADNTYNQQIIQYLKDNDDISSAEMKQILVGLGFTVTDNGKIYWS